MRRHGLGSLIVFVVITVGAIGGTFLADNKPLLGLDLQGGVAVVLEPKEKVDDSALDQAIEIIRNRVDALGVAEPEINQQGGNIIVQLPGVKDRERALELVGQTAELRFRPVLQDLGPTLPEDPASTSTTATTVAGETTTTTAPAVSDSTTTTVAGEQGLAPGGSGTNASPVLGGPDEPTTTTTAPPEGTTTTAAPEGGSTTTTAPVEVPGLDELTPDTPEEDDPATQVILPSIDGGSQLLLGPSVLTGEALQTASARLEQTSGSWSVSVVFRASGIDQFNALASQCFAGDPTVCPSKRVAIVLDSVVQSAPTIQQPSYERDQIQITGDFTEKEAKDLALVLRYGALPVELVAQQSQTVSATLGKDALDAGVISGVIGLALVAVYMILYYRLLGFIAILSLACSGALLWAIVAYLGTNSGLALTLAGVTGIIVSIGVTVDSNVVFYEHLKEDVARGRTIRSAVDASFSNAFSTIVKANMASLIGAAILWYLTVGPVRGFAFYLMVSTVLDLLATYFFMRPVTMLLVRNRRLQDRPRVFGLPAPPAVTA